LTLFPLCFFRFSSILLASSAIRKRVAVFSIQYFIVIFGTGIISLKSLEAQISSVEVSEEGILLIVFNDGFGEIGNTFWNFVTEVEGTQTRAIYGGAVSKQVVVALVSEMEKKCSGTPLRLKG